MAKACGIADSLMITTMAEVEALVPKLHELKGGPRFANVKIDGGNIERILPMRDGTFIVNRIGARSDTPRYSRHPLALLPIPGEITPCNSLMQRNILP